MNQTFSVALNQPAGQRNFSAYWDDDYTLTLRVYATDDPEDVNPIDLTGAILVFKVAQYPYSSNVVVSGQDGVFTFDRPFRACGAREEYTIELTLNGDTTTVAYGTVVVAPRAEQYGTGCGPWGRWNTGAFIGPLQLLVDQAKVASDAAVVAAALAVPAAEAAEAANAAAQQALADMRAESAWLTAFFLPGDVDYTAAWNRAGLAARRVLVPPGTYTMANASFVANTEYYGVGDTSILVQKSGFELFSYDSGSASTANNLVNVSLRDLQLRGRCDTDGFNEQRHLIRASGITNFIVERVLFKGFQGDGLYVGSGVGTERHNLNVKSLNCRYDGINKANRNGISIIDCDGFLSQDDYFENTTQPNMPGAIDIEPNENAYHVVRNISVVRARAKNIGGNVAVYGLVSNASLTNQPTNIQFIQCEADTFSAEMFHVRTNVLPTSTTQNTNVVIDRAVGRNGLRPYYFQSGKGITLLKCQFTDFTQSAYVGQTVGADPLARVRDVVDDGSTYLRCGSTVGIGIYIFNVDYYTSAGVTMDDCGTGMAGSSNAIDFGTGTSTNVVFRDFTVRSPTGKTLFAIAKEAGHTFSASTNLWRKNRIGTLGNSFQAYDSDEIYSTYPTAVIAQGGTTAGAGVYTRQVGTFMLDGKHGEARIELYYSSHTGTGPLNISLPVSVSNVTGRNLQYVNVLTCIGITVTGTLVAVVNPLVTIGGVVGVIQLMDRLPNGTQSLVTVPAGAVQLVINAGFSVA